MKDFLGKTLDKDDIIVIMAAEFQKPVFGKVVGFLEKEVVVRYFKNWSDSIALTSRDPDELIKVDGPELTMILLQHPELSS